MKLWLCKVRRGDKVGLTPSDDESHAALCRLGDGEVCEVRIVRPRSVPMNRRFFAILRDIGQNQEPTRTEESILAELKVLAGHYESIWVDGYEVRIPKSIAFNNMTHDEWMALWPELEMAGIRRFGEEYWLEHA